MEAEDAVTTLAVMLGVGLVARLVADALRLPEMLLLLAAGALAGPSMLGWVDLPLDATGAQLILTLGVSFILFHGGLGLSLGVLSRTAFGLGLLVVPGVVITAIVVGGVAAAVFGVGWQTGLLIGAVLASTDPAILIPLFDRLRLRPKVSQTIIAESALNDPAGAVLALAVAGGILGGSSSVADPAVEFLTDLAISTALGVVIGVALSLAISSHRAGVWRESAEIAVVAVVAASFVSIDFAGGSGYLGAFLAGLIVGNMDRLRLGMHEEHRRSLEAFAAEVADIVVILVFTLVGINLPWSAIGDHWLPALAVAATLMLVARPLAVAACLLPDRRGRWTREEMTFLVWTRETGVIPAALAGILVGLGVPDADLVVVCVAVALVATVTVQSTTKPWLARRLGLLEDRGQAEA